jgi:hypothetical protein
MKHVLVVGRRGKKTGGDLVTVLDILRRSRGGEMF